MYHLDNNSGVVTRPDIPAVQSSQPRWFTEGGNGTPPSYPGAHWFNTVQAELLGVLTAANITPNKHQLNQLTLAIQALIGNQIRSHTHPINQVTGLSEALQGLSNSKAPLAHLHNIAEIEGLQDKLEAIDAKHAILRDVSADLQDFGNLCLDPTLLTPKLGFSWRAGPTGGESIGGRTVRVISDRDNIYSRKVKVKAGDRFYLSYQYLRKQGSAPIAIGLLLDWDKSSRRTLKPSDATRTNLVGGVTKIDCYVDVPEGYDYAQLWLQIDQYNTNATQYYVDNVEWRRIPQGLATSNDFSRQRIGNFDVIRYPDGTMIQTCLHRLGGLDNNRNPSTLHTLVYPLSFLSEPVVNITPQLSHPYFDDTNRGVATNDKSKRLGSNYWEANDGLIGLTMDCSQSQLQFFYENNSVYESEMTFHIIAVGRWK